MVALLALAISLSAYPLGRLDDRYTLRRSATILGVGKLSYKQQTYYHHISIIVCLRLGDRCGWLLQDHMLHLIVAQWAVVDHLLSGVLAARGKAIAGQFLCRAVSSEGGGVVG